MTREFECDVEWNNLSTTLTGCATLTNGKVSVAYMHVYLRNLVDITFALNEFERANLEAVYAEKFHSRFTDGNTDD